MTATIVVAVAVLGIAIPVISQLVSYTVSLTGAAKTTTTTTSG